MNIANMGIPISAPEPSVQAKTRKPTKNKSETIKLPGGRTGWIRPRGSAWQADFGTVNGKREMKSCETKADAENWLREKALMLQNQGTDGF